MMMTMNLSMIPARRSSTFTVPMGMEQMVMDTIAKMVMEQMVMDTIAKMVMEQMDMVPMDMQKLKMTLDGNLFMEKE